jgi:hypothetical protein
MSPTEIGCLKRKEFTATVAIRPRARRIAGIAAAMSHWAMTQPPKMSPLPFMSAGIGITRSTGSRPAIFTPSWPMAVSLLVQVVSIGGTRLARLPPECRR